MPKNIENENPSDRGEKLRAVARRFANEDNSEKSHLLAWAIAIFVIVVGGGIAAFIYFRPPAAPNVGVNIAKSSDQALIGDPFNITVSLSNYSANTLTGAELTVTLPQGMIFVGGSAGVPAEVVDIGDIPSGSVQNQDFSVVAQSGSQSVESISAKLVYSTDAAPKNRFESDANMDVVVGNHAIGLNFSVPQSVASGQPFDMDVAYSNNAGNDFKNVALSVIFPSGFVFQNAEPSPNEINGSTAVWQVGNLPASGNGKISITGIVNGGSDQQLSIGGTVTGDPVISGNSGVSGSSGASSTLVGATGSLNELAEASSSFSISQSPLSLGVSVNNSDDYISKAGDDLNYIITYTNNSSTTFQNVVISAALTGDMFNLSSLKTDGAFDSVNDIVTWSPSNAPGLVSIAPGASGSVSFDVQTQGSYPIARPSDKDFLLDVKAEISSPTVQPGVAAQSTVSSVDEQTKIGGAVALMAQGYFNDPSSGISNSGPYPPKVNKTTDYTIHWIVTNYATDAQNVTVTAQLGNGVTCTGSMKSNMTTQPVCNPVTGVVTWTIPTIPATTGVIGPPAEADFQIQDTPAINQVGQAVTLIGSSSLTATDGFTGSTLSSSAQAITTDLPDDFSISGNSDRRVSQ